MSRYCCRVVTTFAAVFLSMCIQAGEFIDPLDTPAASTPRASSSLMLSVVEAGPRLVAVGEYGRIVVSDDKGKDWRQVESPVSVDLVSAWFATPMVGWATGHSGVILKTVDGGLTWDKLIDGRGVEQLMREHYQRRLDAGVESAANFLRDVDLNFKNGPELPFLDIWFRNERDGFVIGAFGMILATQDGGASWTPWMERVDNPEVLHLNAINNAGDSVLMVGERGTVWELDEETQQFNAYQTGYTGSFFGVTGDSHNFVTFGLRGNAYRSTDGGGTWEALDLPVRSSINAGVLLPDGTLVLATQSHHLMVGEIDGSEFVGFRAEGRGVLASVAPAEPGVLVLAGSSGVQRTDISQKLRPSIQDDEER